MSAAAGAAVADLIDRLAWPQPLYGFQRRGIIELVQRGSLLLADDMGLGKTIQAIGALRCLFAMGEPLPALVIVPAGLLLQWRRQILHWAPELRISTVTGTHTERRAAWTRPAQTYLVGYESLRNDAGLSAVKTREWGAIVLDEAQRIRNRSTDVSIAVKALRRCRSWALTGTPLENRLDDLVSLLDFVAPGRFDPHTYIVGLRALLAEMQLRRRRDELLPELPPKYGAELLLELSRPQRAAYRRAEDEGIVRLRTLGHEVRIRHVLDLLLRLKQICNFCPETNRSAKLDELRARVALASAAGMKTLVFSQFAGQQFGARRLARELAAFDPLVVRIMQLVPTHRNGPTEARFVGQCRHGLGTGNHQRRSDH